MSSVLGRTTLPPKRFPLFLDCHDDTLILFTTDYFLYQYRLENNFNNSQLSSIQLVLLNHIAISGMLQQPLSMTMATSTQCIFLNDDGRLQLFNTENSSQHLISENIEQFWLSDSSKLGVPTLWTYGRTGLQVWFPFDTTSLSAPAKLLSRDKSLEFDLEVYPIGFLPHFAVIVGLCQEILHSSSLCQFSFKIKVFFFFENLIFFFF